MKTMEEELALEQFKLFASDILQRGDSQAENLAIVSFDALLSLTGKSDKFSGKAKSMVNFAFHSISRENSAKIFTDLIRFIDDYLFMAESYFNLINQEALFLPLSKNKIFEKEKNDLLYTVNLIETFYRLYKLLDQLDKNNLVRSIQMMKTLQKFYFQFRDKLMTIKDYRTLFDEYKNFLESKA
jgi:hypothetical protein